MLRRARPATIFAAFATIAVVWLAWHILTIALADSYALSRPDVALRWDPNQSEALIETAKLLSLESEQERHRISELARRAMLADPLQAAPLRFVATVYEADGDERRAETIMTLASRRSLRDVETQIWLADWRLAEGDVERGVAHIDAILRVWPEIATSLFPVLSGLAVNPDGIEAITARLAQQPPWRARFLSALPASIADPSMLVDFYVGLRGAAALSTAELRPFLQALLDRGHAELAYSVAMQHFETLPPPGGLNNGDFETPASGLPFDWDLRKVRGATVQIVEDGDGDRALKVEFHNTRVPFQHVVQALVLTPGAYRITGEEEANDLRNERGMHWTVTCVGGEKTRLGESARLAGNSIRQPFEMVFEVPANPECKAQLLRLELAARIPTEQQIVGEVGYDNFRLDRVQRSAAAE